MAGRIYEVCIDDARAAAVMGNYVYILECSDGSWYTGWTNDLEHRIETHNSGQGAKYTRSRLPVRLIYSEEYETASQARSREYAIKRLTRAQKEELVQQTGTAELSERTDTE